MLLAYGIVRHYWLELDPQVQSAVEALESFENTPTIAPEPPLDDFGYVMDLFLDASNQGTADSEISIAMWLVAGWWPEVKSTWSGIDLPESWRPLIQDIFGNPFRPVAFDPAWRTSTAIALVQQMYDSRDFNLMPILGDALQDAGCVSADILDHCRGDGPHVRGCWVVDLVLGKT
jgi:hypothetical protein